MSPDLNPIENLWRKLKSAIKRRTANLGELEHMTVEVQEASKWLRETFRQTDIVGKGSATEVQ